MCTLGHNNVHVPPYVCEPVLQASTVLGFSPPILYIAQRLSSMSARHVYMLKFIILTCILLTVISSTMFQGGSRN